MSNTVLSATHAGIASLSSAGIMARIANAPLTSAQRQANDAKRYATIAVTGCGLPECLVCYPVVTVEDDGPTAAELAEIEADADREDMAFVLASMRFADQVNARIIETNAKVNTILW